MTRRERRHPEVSEDPVAAAQEEAQWSGYTNLYRMPSQGKLLFPARNLRGWRRVVMIVIALMVLVPMVVGLVSFVFSLVAGRLG
jgi:hypothetical protein